MADPVIEAAQRAWENGPDEVAKFLYRQGEDGIWSPVAMEAAAREAVKPIRELHQRVDDGHPSGLPTCEHCQGDWPCSTASLIYTTEELQP